MSENELKKDLPAEEEKVVKKKKAVKKDGDAPAEKPKKKKVKTEDGEEMPKKKKVKTEDGEEKPKKKKVKTEDGEEKPKKKKVKTEDGEEKPKKKKVKTEEFEEKSEKELKAEAKAAEKAAKAEAKAAAKAEKQKAKEEERRRREMEEEEDDEDDWDEESEGKSHAIWLLLLLIPLIAGGIFGGKKYLERADYYKAHFYPNTAIGEMQVGGMTVEEAKAQFDQSLGEYSLTIHQPEGDQQITSKDISKRYNMEDAHGNDLIQGYMDMQTPIKWIAEYKESYAFPELSVIYDQDALERMIGRLNCVNPSEKHGPVDAHIELDEATSTYVIVPEAPGNVVDRQVASDVIYKALDTWEDEVEIPDDAFEQAAVKSDDPKLAKFLNDIENVMKAEITYEEANGTTVVVDRSVISDFLIIDPENAVVDVDEEKVAAFINSKLDGAFDTIGRSRTITTSLSGTFTISGGTFGRIVSTADELPKLVEDIKNGNVVKRSPAYRTGDSNGTSNDGIGDTFVDVNLTKQQLLFVKNGQEFMTSKFVSGCTKKKRGTHTGIFTVEIKATNYTMRKFHVTVKYWMNFNTAEGEGFHDASWRKSFGGTIYKRNGSHGCINMPTANAKKLYNNLPYGTPVLVHY